MSSSDNLDDALASRVQRKLSKKLGRRSTRRFELYVCAIRHSIATDGKNPSNPKEVSMRRAYVTSAVAGAFLLGMATAAMAVTGEYGNMCSMGLALGKDIQTDCSINAQIEGKTYCFGSKEAMAEFMKHPKKNLAKAQTYYSKKHPG
jgi:YHS domain-containing protein